MRRVFFAFCFLSVVCFYACSGRESDQPKEEGTVSSDNVCLSHGYFDISTQVEPEVELVPLEPAKACNFQEIDDIFFDRGQYYLVSKAEGCIYIFSGKGKYITTFNKKGEGSGEYNSLDACLVDDGVIYIADNRLGKVFSYDKKYNLMGTYDVPLECFLHSGSDYKINTILRYPDRNEIYLINYITQIMNVIIFDITIAFQDEPIYPFNENLQQNDTTLMPLKRMTDRFRFPVNSFLLPSDEKDSMEVYTELNSYTRSFLTNNHIQSFYRPTDGEKIFITFKENKDKRFIYHNGETKTSKLYDGFSYNGLVHPFLHVTFHFPKSNEIIALWNLPTDFSVKSGEQLFKKVLENRTSFSEKMETNNLTGEIAQPVIIKFSIKEGSVFHQYFIKPESEK